MMQRWNEPGSLKRMESGSGPSSSRKNQTKSQNCACCMLIRKRLVEECMRFSRQAGYQKITLWTQSILHAARHIYKQAGFKIVREEKHHSFGKDLTAETWELDLMDRFAMRAL